MVYAQAYDLEYGTSELQVTPMLLPQTTLFLLLMTWLLLAAPAAVSALEGRCKRLALHLARLCYLRKGVLVSALTQGLHPY